MATINFKDPELIENLTISMKIWTHFRKVLMFSLWFSIVSAAIRTALTMIGGA